jgi:alpha-D-ribose 1-methylphosphonate 5-triphosphate synthase subunit PhnH
MTVGEISAPARAALSPETARRMFRAVLDALARPGLPARLPEPDRPGRPAALLPALALADLGTGVCVLGGPPEVTRTLATATSAPPVDLARARLVTALHPIRPDEVAALRRGTPGAPEEGALLCVQMRGLYGGRRLRLSGPGVPGRRSVAPDGLPEGFLAARAASVAGYPAGIDVLLVAPDGGLLGLPRTTVIEEGND